MSFEIVKGDYGRTYRGILENIDYHDCTAKIYVWSPDLTKLIDGKSCDVSYIAPNTYIDYTPVEADFKDATPGVYFGQIKLEKTGVAERTIKFVWEVFEKEP